MTGSRMVRRGVSCDLSAWLSTGSEEQELPRKAPGCQDFGVYLDPTWESVLPELSLGFPCIFLELGPHLRQSLAYRTHPCTFSMNCRSPKLGCLVTPPLGMGRQPGVCCMAG